MNKNWYLGRVANNLRNPLFPYWTASAYGFRKWISKYGCYPSFLPLCIYTDHGPGFHKPAPHELKSDAPVQFYHCKQSVELWKELSGKECQVLFSPFVFARNALKISFNPEARGSVYFMSHGTANARDLTPIDLFIKDLESVPEKYKPVSICLHFNEVSLGYGEIYEKLGYQVVTAGDPVDQQFTERFYKILSTSRYAFSSAFGSHALYAAEMGVPFGLYGTKPNYWNDSDPNIDKGSCNHYLLSDYYQQAFAIFDGLPGEHVTAEQMAFARRYLGVDDGVSRLKMAWILYTSLGIWLWGKFKKLVLRLLHNRT